jgi:hypothetical protein
LYILMSTFKSAYNLYSFYNLPQCLFSYCISFTMFIVFSQNKYRWNTI